MYQDKYYVDKRSGTFADVLLAFGLARLLQVLADDGAGPGSVNVRLRDAGPYFEVALSQPVHEEWLRRASFQSLAPYVQRQSEGASSIPPEVEKVNVDELWAKVRAQAQTRRATQAAADVGSEAAQDELLAVSVDPRFELVRWLNEWRKKGGSTYNEIVRRWLRARDLYRLNVEHLLRYFSMPGQDADQAKANWRRDAQHAGANIETDATLIQILNPSCGQGQNEPKSNRANTRTNLDGWWLLEYLKVVGLYECAVPRIVQGTNDRKAYVISPYDLSLLHNRRVLERFQRALRRTTAVKMDALAAIEYTRALLQHCAEHPDFAVQVYGKSLLRAVSGLHAAYYKNLGQASAVMNLSFINLPRWAIVRGPGDVERLLDVLGEHRNVICGIDEDRGGYELLVSYRDFLSGGSFEPFFDFTAGYAHFAIQQMARSQRRVALFTVDNIGGLLMSSENQRYSEIAQSQGIQDLAYAIRHATIVPQLRKAQNQDTPYEVRYGLSDELRRALPYKDKLVEAISKFVESYQRENGRVLEKQKRNWRRDIRDSTLREVLMLIDKYGSRDVGNVLIALGYAREARESDEGAGQAGENN